MEKLLEKSDMLIANTKLPHKRRVQGNINHEWQMNGIYGARGVGKTTMLLQTLKELKKQGKEVLYVRLDDIHFADNKLYGLADEFRKNSGEYLYLDEVHKYQGWSRELKNIYDSMPALKIVFSGSSIIELTKQEADLSRRALMYSLPGLSFREYLLLSDTIHLPVYDFSDILTSHNSIAVEISTKIPVLKYFKQYLKSGFYPFFLEKKRDYLLTLEQVIRTVIEVDFLHIEQFDSSKSKQILSLLKVVAASAPFIPNISKIGNKTGLHRQTILLYMNYLEKAGLIKMLNYPHRSISRLQKPDKLFLDNPNLFFALNPGIVNTGSLRETFTVNQLSVKHEVDLHKEADFLVDDKYIIEVGGKNKEGYQVSGLDNAFLFLDDIEVGYKNRIPLWLLGFLY
ncbi:MAG: AAA family ATPase [Bacteroidales bacterium]|nr:AAA family ATPase [Bacteroidales bacterium]